MKYLQHYGKIHHGVITNCTFENNKVACLLSGSVLKVDQGEMVVKNTEFTANNLTGDSEIILCKNYGKVTLSSVTMKYNERCTIKLHGCTMDISKSNVHTNIAHSTKVSASNLTISDSNFIGNRGFITVFV